MCARAKSRVSTYIHTWAQTHMSVCPIRRCKPGQTPTIVSVCKDVCINNLVYRCGEHARACEHIPVYAQAKTVCTKHCLAMPPCANMNVSAHTPQCVQALNFIKHAPTQTKKKHTCAGGGIRHMCRTCARRYTCGKPQHAFHYTDTFESPILFTEEARTHAGLNTRVCVCVCVCVCVRKHVCVPKHWSNPSCKHTCVSAYIHVWARVETDIGRTHHVLIHSYVWTYTHVCTHTHMHDNPSTCMREQKWLHIRTCAREHIDVCLYTSKPRSPITLAKAVHLSLCVCACSNTCGRHVCVSVCKHLRFRNSLLQLQYAMLSQAPIKLAHKLQSNCSRCLLSE